MPRFSANLSFLWPDADPCDRIRAAAGAGFKAVEILFPHEWDVPRLEVELQRYGLELALFDVPPGNREKGDRGTLCIPGREDECLAAVRQALELARRFNTCRLNLLAGMLPPGLPRKQALAHGATVLRKAGDLAQAAGVQLLIENISPPAAPGYFAGTVEQAAELIAAAGHPAIRLQLDQYHVSMVGADPLAAAERYASITGHVQIADVPGRHQPGSGAAPIAAFLEKLDDLGYGGYVGLEYAPEGGTDEALAWLPRERR